MRTANRRIVGGCAGEEGNAHLRWFDQPNIAFLAPVPIATAILVVVIWRSLWRPNERLTFVLAIGSFAGLAISSSIVLTQRTLRLAIR